MQKDHEALAHRLAHEAVKSVAKQLVEIPFAVASGDADGEAGPDPVEHFKQAFAGLELGEVDLTHAYTVAEVGHRFEDGVAEVLSRQVVTKPKLYRCEHVPSHYYPSSGICPVDDTPLRPWP